MGRVWWSAALAALALALAIPAVAACSGDDEDEGIDELSDEFSYLEAAEKDALFFVRMKDYHYTPDVLEFNTGDIVAIAIQNDVPTGHDFTIDKIDADVHVSYIDGLGHHVHRGDEADPDLHIAMTERGSGVIHLRVNEAGEYTFYCTLHGHREQGMEGTLIVH